MRLLHAKPVLVIGLMLGACCERLAETRHGKQGTGAPDNHRSPAERSDAGVYTGADEVPDSDGGRFSFVPTADVLILEAHLIMWPLHTSRAAAEKRTILYACRNWWRNTFKAIEWERGRMLVAMVRAEQNVQTIKRGAA